MSTLTRPVAIDRLSRQRLLTLDPCARAELLLDWWGLGDEHPEFAGLPPTLRQLMFDHPEPPADAQDRCYDPLLLLALRAQYHGVTNGYLSRCLAEAGGAEHRVEGSVEPLLACPCCGYLTLGARAEYEICDLCHWEDDGSQTPDVYSGPNHMTLAQARDHFARHQGELALDKWPRTLEAHP